VNKLEKENQYLKYQLENLSSYIEKQQEEAKRKELESQIKPSYDYFQSLSKLYDFIPKILSKEEGREMVFYLEEIKDQKRSILDFTKSLLNLRELMLEKNNLEIDLKLDEIIQTLILNKFQQ